MRRGAIAEKTFLFLQFGIETVDLDGGQTGSAVAGDTGCRDGVFGH